MGDLKDRHFCDWGDMINSLRAGNKTLLHSTDCGPLLAHADRLGYGNAEEAVRSACATQSPLILYARGDWGAPSNDNAMIEAAGRGVPN